MECVRSKPPTARPHPSKSTPSCQIFARILSTILAPRDLNRNSSRSRRLVTLTEFRVAHMLTRHRTIVVASMVAAIAAGLWIGAGVLSASVTNERGNEGKVASSNHMTVRRYLATYWGRQWPVVESSIPDEQRPVLDTYIDTEQVTPWE